MGGGVWAREQPAQGPEVREAGEVGGFTWPGGAGHAEEAAPAGQAVVVWTSSQGADARGLQGTSGTPSLSSLASQPHPRWSHLAGCPSQSLPIQQGSHRWLRASFLPPLPVRIPIPRVGEPH